MVVDEVVKMTAAACPSKTPFLDQAKLRTPQVQARTGAWREQSLVNNVHSVGLDLGRFDLHLVIISAEFVTTLDLFYGRICPIDGVLEDRHREGVKTHEVQRGLHRNSSWPIKFDGLQKVVKCVAPKDAIARNVKGHAIGPFDRSVG